MTAASFVFIHLIYVYLAMFLSFVYYIVLIRVSAIVFPGIVICAHESPHSVILALPSAILQMLTDDVASGNIRCNQISVSIQIRYYLHNEWNGMEWMCCCWELSSNVLRVAARCEYIQRTYSNEKSSFGFFFLLSLHTQFDQRAK